MHGKVHAFFLNCIGCIHTNSKYTLHPNDEDNDVQHSLSAAAAVAASAVQRPENIRSKVGRGRGTTLGTD